MGDQQHRHPELVLETGEKIEDLRLYGHVQVGGRLVGDQQRRPRGDRRGDEHAVPLPPRQLVRVALEHRGIQSDALQGLGGAFAGAPAAQVGDDAFHDLVADRHHGIERGRGLLKDDRDPASAVRLHLPLGERDEIGAVEQDPAGGDPRGHGKELQHRAGGHRFPGARAADQGDEFAGRHVERDVLQHHEVAARFGARDREPLDPQFTAGSSIALRGGRGRGRTHSASARLRRGSHSSKVT